MSAGKERDLRDARPFVPKTIGKLSASNSGECASGNSGNSSSGCGGCNSCGGSDANPTVVKMVGKIVQKVK